uniref:Mitochondrial Rho GTPase 1 n=1 Tax=Anthurium amnicola TaxID=1678845 RepID=A0A1D1XSP7_9ARAE
MGLRAMERTLWKGGTLLVAYNKKVTCGMTWPFAGFSRCFHVTTTYHPLLPAGNGGRRHRYYCKCLDFIVLQSSFLFSEILWWESHALLILIVNLLLILISIMWSPVQLREDSCGQRVPVVIHDTPSEWEETSRDAQLRDANVIVLCYSCVHISTFERVKSFWLPLFQGLQLDIPVILVGCQLDRSFVDPTTVEAELESILQYHPEIDTCIECSALTKTDISDVFDKAQKGSDLSM